MSLGSRLLLWASTLTRFHSHKGTGWVPWGLDREKSRRAASTLGPFEVLKSFAGQAEGANLADLVDTRGGPRLGPESTNEPKCHSVNNWAKLNMDWEINDWRWFLLILLTYYYSSSVLKMPSCLKC